MQAGGHLKFTHIGNPHFIEVLMLLLLLVVVLLVVMVVVVRDRDKETEKDRDRNSYERQFQNYDQPKRMIKPQI